jgi:hypothetical protein
VIEATRELVEKFMTEPTERLPETF